MQNIEKELNRLNFEDYLFIVIITLAATNIFSDQLQKKYIKTQNKKYLTESSTIFTITLIITFFVYLYFFKRNYILYKETTLENKHLYGIKALGSLFLIIGILLLIYFQINDSNFIGSPAI